MKKDFLSLYDREYKQHLGVRADSFRFLFDLALRMSKDEYFILETGCLRMLNNSACDGMSTHLFDVFVQINGGKVYSIDKNIDNINLAKDFCSKSTTFFCGDSVGTLYQLMRRGALPDVNIVYLDSFDFDPSDPFPSAFHHVKEIACILAGLAPGTLVCVDDNMVIDGKKTGKGYLMDQLFQNIGATKLYDGYQMIWVVP